jgi:release factor glutamine methyltransferase
MAMLRARPHSFQEALSVAREILGASPELVARGTIPTEAEQLVEAAYRKATGKRLSRLDLFARAADRFPDAAGDHLLILAGTRAEGRPLQHLTGVQVFLNHEYEVGPDVLVPRPETEVLVQQALQDLKSLNDPPVLGLEIGTGSGIISIELLSELPSLRMIASELTAEAEQRARINATRILGVGVSRFQIVRANQPLEVWQPFEGALQNQRADFIISNPPYLALTDAIDDEVIRHEPSTALFAPQSDLVYFYRAVASGAHQFLRSGGLVFMEIAHERAEETRKVFDASGWNVRILPDLTQRDRVLVATLRGKG